MLKNIRKLAVILMAIALIGTGCSSKEKEPQSPANPPAKQQSNETQEQEEKVSRENESVEATDIEGHFYEAQIKKLLDKGFVKLEDGKFEPDKTITRAEFIVWLYNTYEKGLPPVNPDKPTFSDLPKGHEAYVPIETLANNGIVLGHKDGTMKPDDPLTREEFAVIWCIFHRITQYYEMNERNINAFYEMFVSSYSDGKDANKEYGIYLSETRKYYDQVFGKTELIKPKQALTRAEAAGFLAIDNPKPY